MSTGVYCGLRDNTFFRRPAFYSVSWERLTMASKAAELPTENYHIYLPAIAIACAVTYVRSPVIPGSMADLIPA